jgi:ribosomal protein S18 acetylase RimI-like enzyme
MDETEKFLRLRERYCVGACSRYINKTKKDRFWYAGGEFLLYTGRSIFPVFCSEDPPPGKTAAAGVALPKPLKKLLKKENLHGVQGLEADTERLETALEEHKFFPSEKIYYDLMVMENAAVPEDIAAHWARNIPGLVICRPEAKDADGLFPLQAGYEQEEVLPRDAIFYPAVCRKNIEAQIAGGRILAAQLRGRLVGKININAESFTRLQIGGVYVDAAYRGQGIAGAMTRELLSRLQPAGKSFSLFVKKQNGPARSVFLQTG